MGAANEYHFGMTNRLSFVNRFDDRQLEVEEVAAMVNEYGDDVSGWPGDYTKNGDDVWEHADPDIEHEFLSDRFREEVKLKGWTWYKKPEWAHNYSPRSYESAFIAEKDISVDVGGITFEATVYLLRTNCYYQGFTLNIIAEGDYVNDNEFEVDADDINYKRDWPIYGAALSATVAAANKKMNQVIEAAANELYAALKPIAD